MRRRWIKITALVMACTFLTVTTERGLGSINTRATAAPAAKDNNGGAKPAYQADSDDLKVETRKGEAVVLRVKQLKSQKKYFAKAMKDMEKRGLRPAFADGVTLLGVSKSGKWRKTTAQQTTIVEGDVEMTFISYDDGDNSTWEGLIYSRRGQDERLDYAQFNISQGVSVVSEQNYYTNYTLNSQPVDHTLGSLNGEKRGKGRSAEIVPISYVFGANAKSKSAAAQDNGARLQDWAVCAAAGCVSGAVGCWVFGPGWAACAAAACLAIMLGCLLEAIFNFLPF